MALRKNRVVSGVARTYSVIFRGTPLVLQLVFVFTALPHAGIVLGPIMAAGVALAANQATCFAEFFRHPHPGSSGPDLTGVAHTLQGGETRDGGGRRLLSLRSGPMGRRQGPPALPPTRTSAGGSTT
jgi:hypothetical protein